MKCMEVKFPRYRLERCQSIFRDSLLNNWTSIEDVAECLSVRPKASSCVHVSWSLHTRSQRKNKVAISNMRFRISNHTAVRKLECSPSLPDLTLVNFFV